MVISVLWQERPSHPPAYGERDESARRSSRAKARAREPACAATRLREPSAAKRGRPARRANPGGACRYLDHADLYSYLGRAPQKPGAGSAPIGRRLTRTAKGVRCGRLDLPPIAGLMSPAQAWRVL